MLRTWVAESSFLGSIRTNRPLTRPDKSGHPLPLGEGWSFLRFLPSPLGRGCPRPRTVWCRARYEGG